MRIITLAFATVLILIALPYFYPIGDDMRGWCLMELLKKSVLEHELALLR